MDDDEYYDDDDDDWDGPCYCPECCAYRAGYKDAMYDLGMYNE
jgi:hypothetical protein